MTTTMAAPDSTGSYGLGHRCRYCGTRIDLAHVSDTGPGEFGWVHDGTGEQECGSTQPCSCVLCAPWPGKPF